MLAVLASAVSHKTQDVWLKLLTDKKSAVKNKHYKNTAAHLFLTIFEADQVWV